MLQSAVSQSNRSVQLLDNGWRFMNVEVVDANKQSFDDTKWHQVVVPHDWAINQNFDMNNDRQVVQVVADGENRAQLRTGRTGALPMFGVGWYRYDLQIS